MSHITDSITPARFTTPLLKVSHLCKRYREAADGHPILHNFQFELNAGQRIAILGRSGCGKSTLLNIIAGLDLPDRGSVWLNGQDLCELDDKQRTRVRRWELGFIFQFFNLIPTLTVLENILLPLELIGVRDYEAQIAKVTEQLATLGLDALKDRFPEQLSGGEQQRVAIVRALAHRPRLLLADEPTGNLDHETGNQVAELLFDAVSDRSALLLVTHSEEIAAKADRTFRLQDGMLVAVTPTHHE